ncbi:hypothetical protein MTR67_052400 [Solanum verrucosum]|uniref:Uncharacterized protein n=1 Tax=Solanum verrucosum TaxID=315347 RepID=A0AAF1A384_SOLVR|nr:hypothetical protein MTR67_052400 [Solanum verrucosum]
MEETRKSHEGGGITFFDATNRAKRASHQMSPPPKPDYEDFYGRGRNHTTITLVSLLFRIDFDWVSHEEESVGVGRLLRKPFRFPVGDRVFLHVYPRKAMMRFGRRAIHPFFHVSMLHWYVPDESHMLEYDVVELDDRLTFMEEPISILARDVWWLHLRDIHVVKSIGGIVQSRRLPERLSMISKSSFLASLSLQVHGGQTTWWLHSWGPCHIRDARNHGIPYREGGEPPLGRDREALDAVTRDFLRLGRRDSSWLLFKEHTNNQLQYRGLIGNYMHLSSEFDDSKSSVIVKVVATCMADHEVLGNLRFKLIAWQHSGVFQKGKALALLIGVGAVALQFLWIEDVSDNLACWINMFVVHFWDLYFHIRQLFTCDFQVTGWLTYLWVIVGGIMTSGIRGVSVVILAGRVKRVEEFKVHSSVHDHVGMGVALAVDGVLVVFLENP